MIGIPGLGKFAIIASLSVSALALGCTTSVVTYSPRPHVDYVPKPEEASIRVADQIGKILNVQLQDAQKRTEFAKKLADKLRTKPLDFETIHGFVKEVKEAKAGFSVTSTEDDGALAKKIFLILSRDYLEHSQGITSSAEVFRSWLKSRADELAKAKKSQHSLLKIYISSLVLTKNYDTSDNEMELYWTTLSSPESEDIRNLEIRYHTASKNHSKVARALNNFMIFKKKVLLDETGTDSISVRLSVFDDDAILGTSQAEQIKNLSEKLRSTLTSNLEPGLGALKYIPIIPIIVDFVKMLSPDDHIITAGIALDSSDLFVPNVQDLRVSFDNDNVILFFSLELFGKRLYHPEDPFWRQDEEPAPQN